MLKAEFEKETAALPDDADAAPFLGTSVGTCTIGQVRGALDGFSSEHSFDLGFDGSRLLVYRDGKILRKVRSSPEREKRKGLRKRADEKMSQAEENEQINDVTDKLDMGRVRKDRKDPARLP
jgi:hypothetical protein